MYIILVFLFSFPIILNAFKQSFFNPFTFRKLVITLNKSLLHFVVIGVVMCLIAIIIDKVFYTSGTGNVFTDTFIQTTYSFVVIGTFIFLPVIGLLNLINWIRKKRDTYGSR